MNILLLDTVVPPSVFSGKTVRLYGLYGRLARKHNIVFVRPAKEAFRSQSPEVEEWCSDSFSKSLLLQPLPKPPLAGKIKAVARLRPYYDIAAKHTPAVMEALKKELLDIIRENQISLVITFSIEAAPYGALIAGDCPWIQDLTDSMVLQMRRRIQKSRRIADRFDLAIRLLRETGFEKEMVERAQLSTFVADDDAALYTGRKVTIVSNGVDTEYFNPEAVVPFREAKPYVVFTGHMSFPPNQDAAIFFAREILPLVRKSFPKLGFKVVGADPAPAVRALEEIPGVEVTGRIPDLRPYLAGAEAFVCPMRMGSGIKNKLLEAMAMKLPIISSGLALEGIEPRPVDLSPAALEPQVFADVVVETLRIPVLSRRKENYRNFVAENYSWDKRVSELEALLQKAKREEGAAS